MLVYSDVELENSVVLSDDDENSVVLSEELSPTLLLPLSDVELKGVSVVLISSVELSLLLLALSDEASLLSEENVLLSVETSLESVDALDSLTVVDSSPDPSAVEKKSEELRSVACSEEALLLLLLSVTALELIS